MGYPKFHPFGVGQLVLMTVQKPCNLTVNKLSPNYKRPLTVTKGNENGVTYVVTDVASRVTMRAHHTDLHLYWTPPDYHLGRPNNWMGLLNEVQPIFELIRDPVKCFAGVGCSTQTFSDSDSDMSGDSGEGMTECDQGLVAGDNLGSSFLGFLPASHGNDDPNIDHKLVGTR